MPIKIKENGICDSYYEEATGKGNIMDKENKCYYMRKLGRGYLCTNQKLPEMIVCNEDICPAADALLKPERECKLCKHYILEGNGCYCGSGEYGRNFLGEWPCGGYERKAQK